MNEPQTHEPKWKPGEKDHVLHEPIYHEMYRMGGEAGSGLLQDGGAGGGSGEWQGAGLTPKGSSGVKEMF